MLTREFYEEISFHGDVSSDYHVTQPNLNTQSITQAADAPNNAASLSFEFVIENDPVVNLTWIKEEVLERMQAMHM